jgi:hypothetical protein
MRAERALMRMHVQRILPKEHGWASQINLYNQNSGHADGKSVNKIADIFFTVKPQ